MPFRSAAGEAVSPAAASSVGSMSSCAPISLMIVPGLITPGQRMNAGTRKPPSHCVFFSPLNMVVPPSGQVNVSAPLSVEYMTMVLASRPSSVSLASTWPTWPSCSTMPSAYTPSPVLPSEAAFRCVKTCILVEFHQRKNGLSAFFARSMKSSAFAVTSSSIVSMRLRVRGPVSLMRPSAKLWITPRGPYCFLKAGSFG